MQINADLNMAGRKTGKSIDASMRMSRQQKKTCLEITWHDTIKIYSQNRIPGADT